MWKLFSILFLPVITFGQVNFPTSSPVTIPGSDTQLFYNGSGSLSGITKAITNDTCLVLSSQSPPPTVTSNDLYLAASTYGTRCFPEAILKDGRRLLQPSSGQTQRSEWRPHGSNTSATSGGITFSTTGTAINVIPGAGNRYESSRRIGYRTNSSNNSVAGVRSNPQYCIGVSGSGEYGGFYVATHVYLSTAPSTARVFSGLHDQSAFPSGSTLLTDLTNIIGVGYAVGTDSNYKLFHNDGSGTASSVDLGADFPTTATNTSWIRLELMCVPGQTSIDYRVTNIKTGVHTAGSLSTNIPSSTTLLGTITYASNGATNSPATVDVGTIYSEIRF